jgi:hypothetical protein
MVGRVPFKWYLLKGTCFLGKLTFWREKNRKNIDVDVHTLPHCPDF